MKKQSRFKPKKAQFTTSRLKWRSLFWEPLKLAARAYVKAAPGNQTRMAHALGIQDSQIHRFVCPVCEHNQETTYSVGCAIAIYLATIAKLPPTVELFENDTIHLTLIRKTNKRYHHYHYAKSKHRP